MPSVIIEIIPRHGCFPVNLLHILRTPFPKITPGGLILLLRLIKSQMWDFFTPDIMVCRGQNYSMLITAIMFSLREKQNHDISSEKIFLKFSKSCRKHNI